MNDQIEQFSQHLTDTAVETSQTPQRPPTKREKLRSQVESSYIDPLMELPDFSYFFRIGGVPCMPAGEIVTITAKAKQGKTFVCSILAAAAFHHECLGILSNTEDYYRILWVDTEQSERSTQDIMKRVLRMAEIDINSYSKDWFPAVNLRKFRWDERVEIVHEAILIHQPDIVIIDGSRDFVRDINDGPECSAVVETMTRWASGRMTDFDDPEGKDIMIRPMLILNVIHENKALDDYTLRGHLGTELTNKSFEIYQCKVDDSRIFSFTQTASRVAPVKEPFQYTVNAEGLPERYDPNATMAEIQQVAPTFQPKEKKIKDFFKHRDGSYNLSKIFSILLPKDAKTPSTVLFAQLVRLLNISATTADRLINTGIEQHIVLKEVIGGKGVLYSSIAQIKQQPEIEFDE